MVPRNRKIDFLGVVLVAGLALSSGYQRCDEADRGQVISREPVVAGCDAPEILRVC